MKKTDKRSVLFARLTEENSEYLTKVAKKFDLNKTEFLNSHIAYLRKAFKAGNISNQLAKTRDKI